MSPTRHRNCLDKQHSQACSLTYQSLWLFKSCRPGLYLTLRYFCFISASSFELRYHRNLTVLVNSFETAFDDFSLLDGDLVPPEPFYFHNVILKLPSNDQMSSNNSTEEFYFAVRTLDEANNTAEISNVVFVSFYVHPALESRCSTSVAPLSLLLMIVCCSVLLWSS